MRKFGDHHFKPAQQGELDAFCGIYVAVNYLSRRLLHLSDCDERNVYFERLLRHLSAREKFTVQRVCSLGFKNGQIQAAFNKTARELGLDVKAHELGAVVRKRGPKSLYDLLASLDENEAAMIRVDDREHWVLVHSGRDDRIICDDPYPPAKCVVMSKSAKRFKNADLKNGIVFLNA